MLLQVESTSESARVNFLLARPSKVKGKVFLTGAGKILGNWNRSTAKGANVHHAFPPMVCSEMSLHVFNALRDVLTC